MKAGLQLNLGQQLTMTPQLQQAIRLLQLSSLDLQQAIQEALDSNPLLDVEEFHGEDFDIKEDFEVENSDAKDIYTENLHAEKGQTKDQESAQQNLDIDPSAIDSSTHFEQAQLGDELNVDVSWDELYTANTGQTGLNHSSINHSSINADELPIYQGETIDNLQDHLTWQVSLSHFSETDHAIATALIESLDHTGYLTETIEDIQQSLGDDEIELDEIAVVLKRIQHFDPLGVAARNLQECLLIQLSIYSPETSWLNEAKHLLNEHIDLLAQRDYAQIRKRTRLKEDELKNALTLIQQLDPKPGERIQPDNTEYIAPDLSVKKEQGRWRVTLNTDGMPSLKLNQEYADLIKNKSAPQNQADTTYIRNQTQEAKWFIQAVQNRHNTLLAVATCIVAHQYDFFERGEQAMKPMILADIARQIDMHESTISRATTQKYMHTPHGIFELKYFFSSHVNTDQGGECSSTAIRAMIKQLVDEESPQKPLSDNKIATLLADQGIQVARRTITKYRESLGVESSSQRKRL